MKNKFLRNKAILSMAAFLTIGACMLSGCSDDEEYADSEYTDDAYSDDDNISDDGEQSMAVDEEANSQLPQFKAVKAIGDAASIRKNEMQDSDSEEIMDLVNAKHIIDQSFDNTEYATTISEQHEGSWGIYVYMCGSDLESGGGAATEDLNEMINAEFSENVNVVIQTGGSSQWMNEMVNPDYLERYIINADGMEQVDQIDNASMGAESTLIDFLSFCDENYPADNQMVIFWNHGGGSLGGACYDENFDFDHLTLNEMNSAFDTVFGEKRIAAVGYDCCLMASIDTANMLKNHAEMMIASEETEPGNGWYYTDWLTDLNSNPEMSNAELGKSICDSYMKGCEEVGTEDETTLSVVDLNKINLVVDSLNSFSTELLGKISDDASVLTRLGRVAGRSENYGGNTESSGYFDLVDIGDFIKNATEDSFDTKEYITGALNSAVVYNVKGALRSNATGLSMYYPYDSDLASQQKYESVAASDLYAGINRLMLTGDMNQDTVDLFTVFAEKSENVDEQATASVSTKSLSDSVSEASFTNNGENIPMAVDDEGYLTASIDAKDMNNVESVTAELLYYVEDADTYLSLGIDNDVDVDWDKGIIKDNFRGVWACLDGHVLYMDLCFEGDDYNLYNVPVKINGKNKDMTVAYYYDSESYKIVSVSDSVDGEASNQCATKANDKLKAGDEITTIFYYYDYDKEEWIEFDLDTFTYSDNAVVKEEELDEGEYAIMFMTDDIKGNTVFSEYGYIEYKEGDIYTYVE